MSDPRQTAGSTNFTVVDVLLLGVVTVWGVNVVVVKLALASMHPLLFNSMRFLLAASLSLTMLHITERGHRLRRADLPIIIGLGLLGHAMYQVLFIFGINLTTAGNTSLLLATMPIWVAVLSAAFRLDEVNLFTWLGIACSFLGIALVILGGGKTIAFALSSFRGDAMILMATLLMATYTLLSRPLLSRYTPLQLSSYTMTAGAIALLLVSLPILTTTDFSTVAPIGWGGVVFSSVFAVVLGYYVWNRGLQLLGPARTAIYNNLSPVVAMLTGWIVLAERVTTTQFVGAGLIFTGLLLARKRARNKNATI
jgi:drug/metabolite transporter (DMT)-like permease